MSKYTVEILTAFAIGFIVMLLARIYFVETAIHDEMEAPAGEPAPGDETPAATEESA